MQVGWNQEYYKTKTDEELDVLVAEAAGLKLSSLAGEGGWVDSTGALIHLQSEFHPTSKTNYALTLLQEIAADGNGLAINTADVMSKSFGIIIGGFPFEGEEPLPMVQTPIEDINNFGEFRKAFLRSICVFYVMYKHSMEDQ